MNEPEIEVTHMDSQNVIDTEGSLWKIENPQQVNFVQAADTGCLYKYTGDGELWGWRKLKLARATKEKS